MQIFLQSATRGVVVILPSRVVCVTSACDRELTTSIKAKVL